MVPARDIQNSDNIFTIAEKQGMDAQALKKLLSTHLQHLKKDNTPKEWERFNATKNGPLEIIDGTIDFSDIAFYVNDGLYSTLLSNDTTAL
ncbi:MAG: hypothetical protein LBD75_08315 [Candidatus Peribacteria bacterium]|jgi:predicted DsbA family dithiol-disulfide isomerase|nr:hypothetical protein [Candidatus Peribacteria bacterium]